MGLALRPGAAVALMLVGFVDDFQHRRRQRPAGVQARIGRIHDAHDDQQQEERRQRDGAQWNADDIGAADGHWAIRFESMRRREWKP